ncbi:hypothetical protein JRG66_01405 [Salinimicrobium tongyeongense]|uniref:PH domain-containing protein n=1 Tax=Salinimicrobium tongyeongense TaxID=2809707 RepID=A0ABY6NRN9_9FLAO|nr:hypothetical protein [Salinimicrobium tongyeongense]UZH55581.1 hypothetical protein JRG66_01405 [Salinimicrobium tongyeongense]
MKIRYSKRRLFSNLILGALFAILGGLRIFEGTATYFTYFQLFLGILMVGTFFFEKKNQYLSIEKGFLTKNSLRRKTIELHNIIKVQSYPGSVKLFTSEEKIGINTGIIEKDSLQQLLNIIGSLEVQENPFAGYATKTT